MTIKGSSDALGKTGVEGKGGRALEPNCLCNEPKAPNGWVTRRQEVLSALESMVRPSSGFFIPTAIIKVLACPYRYLLDVL